MPNGWTGGQYSLLRVVVGVTLAVPLVSSPSPGAAGAAAAALALALGWHDRVAALVLAWAWLLLMEPAPGQELATTAVALLLVVHAAQTTAPFGSWDARGRIDPGAGWAFRRALRLAVWILLAMAQAAAGLHAFATGATRDPLVLGLAGLQLVFGPFALIRSVRPWLWLTTIGLHLAVAAIGPMPLSLGMVLLYLFTFDPSWVPRRAPGVIETLFYDGSCGLCHRAVRFLLAEDADGAALRFAPLGSDTFRAQVPEAERARLPDSLVLVATDGRVLTRSTAVRHLLERLGGTWRVLATLVRIVPARLQDAAYDAIARIRYRLFARPKDACPILPPHLRGRFLA
jgi:predicted DCC family thiol-disulfide oxidoreductase YuxK